MGIPVINDQKLRMLPAVGVPSRIFGLKTEKFKKSLASTQIFHIFIKKWLVFNLLIPHTIILLNHIVIPSPAEKLYLPGH